MLRRWLNRGKVASTAADCTLVLSLGQACEWRNKAASFSWRNEMGRIVLRAALFFVPLLGCTTVGKQPSAQADCSSALIPADRLIGSSFTDKFNGLYWNGAERLQVWREDQRLFLGRAGESRVQLQRQGEIAGEGWFRDGCNTSYQFQLPPDGPGGYLTIAEPHGARSEWHRRPG